MSTNYQIDIMANLLDVNELILPNLHRRHHCHVHPLLVAWV